MILKPYEVVALMKLELNVPFSDWSAPNPEKLAALVSELRIAQETEKAKKAEKA